MADKVPRIVLEDLIPTIGGNARQIDPRSDESGDKEESVAHVRTLTPLACPRQVEVQSKDVDRLRHNLHHLSSAKWFKATRNIRNRDRREYRKLSLASERGCPTVARYDYRK
jgi:hypothetical protein